MKRRTFIRLASGGIVLAAAAGGIYGYARSVSPVPASATAAWREAGQQTDPRQHALAHAILAPNPHNMQPWKADLTTSREISVSLDEQRLLPATDPFGRQILMGLGAFVELLKMAAAQTGHACEVTLFPDGEPGEYLDGRRMARIAMIPQQGIETDPLFAEVLNRRTDRRAYDISRQITGAEISALVAAAAPHDVKLGVEAAAKLDAIKQIAREAWFIELTTEGPMMESVKVLRVGSHEIDTHRDGIAIDDPLLVLIERAGLFDRSSMPAPDSQAVQAQLSEFDAVTTATPAYLWITTQGNSRRQQVEAGAAYLRANLAATGLGLSLHPNQQALQEYREVAAQYAAIHQLLDAPSPQFTVQMLARLGHILPGSGAVPPAPRRGLPALLG
ncbi:MAG: twin-arginine translocation pathway signal protein [Anderseniella sp.]|jgi:hypothetical protein|nr:twin-arginine translocation pathway signal protein [Anderseniella sp.]